MLPIQGKDWISRGSGLSVLISVGISIRMKTQKCSLDMAERLAVAGVVQWHEEHRRVG